LPFLSTTVIVGLFRCQLVDAALPSGMLKQGLPTSRTGPTREAFASRLRAIHQRLQQAKPIAALPAAKTTPKAKSE
jgi:hypothetical protein